MDQNNFPQDITRLMISSLCGKATADELKQLESWLEENEKNRAFYNRISNRHYRNRNLQEFSKYNSRQDWLKVKTAIRKKQRKRLLHLLPYAAILVLALGIWGLLGYHSSSSPQITGPVSRQTYPETFKAHLILDGGQILKLSSQNPVQSVAGEVFVNNGQLLSYSLSDTQTKAHQHILQVPRGGEYQVILSDGTKVWLNADSELRYPDRFTEKVRKVELSGEAYFEVSRDIQRPFLVSTKGMEIKVLGTSFNISAYPDENSHTTLVKGKVAVSAGNQQLELYPGQQAALIHGEIKVRQVNVNNYTGWKESRFIYEDKPLGEVLRELERWYNVNIDLAAPDIADIHFTANLPKYARFEQVAEIIEYTTCIKFEINHDRLLVRKDK